MVQKHMHYYICAHNLVSPVTGKINGDSYAINYAECNVSTTHPLRYRDALQSVSPVYFSRYFFVENFVLFIVQESSVT